ERAEDRIDAAIVGNVVPEIFHRRGEERRQPDRRHVERGDVVEMPGDAVEIADAVAVRVGEAARIDLIDRRAAPPGTLDRHCPPPAAQMTKSSGASATR